MSMMVSFVLSFFPRDVLDEILNLIESVSEDLPSYSYYYCLTSIKIMLLNIMKKSMKGPVKIFFGQSKIHVRY